MKNLQHETIPPQAIQACAIAVELLGKSISGVYLFGSAVAGGLRIYSDIDVLIVAKHSLSEALRRTMTDRLMLISGKIGNSAGIRPLEVTVVNYSDVIPWRFPPKNEYVYGEWLRNELERGLIPPPIHDPDLAIVLTQVRSCSITLAGSDAAAVLEPVPMADIRKAISESLPALIKNAEGDERNVILTLARMWLTAAVGDISSKDAAAAWALPRLPAAHADLLDSARKAYLGEETAAWEGRDDEISALVLYMKNAVVACLRETDY